MCRNFSKESASSPDFVRKSIILYLETQKALALLSRMPVERHFITMRLSLLLSVCVVAVVVGKASAQSQYESSTDFAKYAMKLRENALLKIEPKVIMSPTKTVFTGDGPRYMTGPSLMGRGAALSGGPGRYSWKRGMVPTIFWIAERPSG